MSVTANIVFPMISRGEGNSYTFAIYTEDGENVFDAFSPGDYITTSSANNPGPFLIDSVVNDSGTSTINLRRPQDTVGESVASVTLTPYSNTTGKWLLSSTSAMYFNAAGEYGANPAILSTTNAFALFYQDGLGASFNPATAQITTNNAANLGPFDLENIGGTECLAVVMTESIAHDTSGDLYTVIQYRTPVGPSTPVLSSVSCLTTDKPLISGIAVTPSSAQLPESGPVTIAFEAYSILGDPTSIHWDFGDGSVDDTDTLTPSHDFATEGMWPVTVTATNDMGSSSCRVYVPIAAYAPLISVTPPEGHSIRQLKTDDFLYMLDVTASPQQMFMYAARTDTIGGHSYTIGDAVPFASATGYFELAAGVTGLCMAYNPTTSMLYITDTHGKAIVAYHVDYTTIQTANPAAPTTIGAGKFEGVFQ